MERVNSFEENNEHATVLFHGSKSGLTLPIKPVSRKSCDFGEGFYLGDKETQPKGLISKYKTGVFYECVLDYSTLKVKEFENNYEGTMEWAMFIAYNRGFNVGNYWESKFKSWNYDLIIGLIADDSMMSIMQEFFDLSTSDKVLIDSLKHVNLGRQYVCKTQKACDDVKIISSRQLTEAEINKAQIDEQYRFNTVKSAINGIKAKYRRSQNVKFFDELIKGGV